VLRTVAASVEAPEPGLLTVTGATPERVGDLAAQNGITLHELVAESDASLEDVFLELTSDREFV
jgi:ABC-2 type transport system ATP-binding protein